MKIDRLKFRKSHLPKILAVAFLLCLSFAFADRLFAFEPYQPIESTIRAMVWAITALIVKFEGWIIIILTKILLSLITYNGFVNAYAVTVGWTLVRDTANLFFVLIFLAIAIGTILHIESYNFKRLLPKVLLMAILINFSRTICGLIIDFAQVVMMTFAVGFASIAGSSQLMSTLHITEILYSATEDKSGEIGTMAVVISGLLAVFLLAIAVIVILTMTVVIAMRMVMLWVLIVLSPLAYIFAAFPQGQQYASQWWSSFTKHVIVGPILAFFLWLAFTVASNGFAGDATLTKIQTDLKTQTQEEEKLGGNAAPKDDSGVFTAIGKVENMLSLIIAICMLMAGLMVTQQLGVAGAGMAGNMYSKIRGMGVAGALKVAKSPLGLAGWGARKFKAYGIGGYGRGVELNPVNIYRGIAHSLEEKRNEDVRRGNIEAGARLQEGGLKGAVLGLGATSWGDNYLHGFMYSTGIQRILYGKAGKAGVFEKQAEEQEKIARAYTEDERTQREHDKEEPLRQAGEVEAALKNNEVLVSGEHSVRKEAKELEKSLRKQAADAHNEGDEPAAEELRKQAEALAEALQNKDKIDLNVIKTANSEAGAKLEDLFRGKQQGYEKKVDDINEDIKERTINGNTVTKEQKEEAKEKAEKLRAKAERAAALTPQDLSGRGERRAAFEEAKKHYGETTNEDELMAAFKSALRHEDLSEAGGIAMQAAKVGHLNELLNDRRASRVYYFDKDGGITEDQSEADTRYGDNGVAFQKGQSFSSDINGFNAFIKDVFVHQLGTNEQIAYSLQNDLSNIAESINHWTYGQAIASTSDGHLRQNNKATQQVRTMIEMSKRDFEGLSRQGNRLAWTTESWIDDSDHTKGRKAILNPVGIANLADNWESVSNNLGRGRFNKNFALNLMTPENQRILDEIKKQYVGAGKGRDFDTFRTKLADFAGRAAKEEGGLGKRVRTEITKSEAIREKIIEKREIFAEAAPRAAEPGAAPLPPEQVERQATEISDSISGHEEAITEAIRANSNDGVERALQQVQDKISQMTDAIKGLDFATTIGAELTRIGKAAEGYKNRPQLLTTSPELATSLLRDLKYQLMRLIREQKRQAEKGEET